MVEKWQDLSVLIVGCGSAGKRHARVLNGMGVGDLRACDPLETQREALLDQLPKVRMYDTYEKGLAARPDTVLICTPPDLHIPQAVQAIRAGSHVLSEKPLSDSTVGLDDLAALAAAEDKQVMVAHCFRYHDGLLKAKEMLDAGRVGRLVSVRALVGEHLPTVRPDYRDLLAAQHQGVFDLMHDIDLAIWYVGLPVKQVYSLSGTFSDIGMTTEDMAEILLGFEDRSVVDTAPGNSVRRCLATIHLDRFQRPRRRQIELIGTGGVIIVEFARWERCTVSIYEVPRTEWVHQELITDRDDMFRAEDREFLQSIADNQPIRCTIAEGRKAVEVVMSATQGTK